MIPKITNHVNGLYSIFMERIRTSRTNYVCCLNYFLMTGPDLLKALSGVLFRFRQRQVAFVGDIKEIRRSTIVWESVRKTRAAMILRRGEDCEQKPDVYQMTTMTFGALCSPSGTMYINDRNAKEFAQQFPEDAKVILDNIMLTIVFAVTTTPLRLS